MKVYLDTIGCRLNQAEIERYAHQLETAGYTLVAQPSDADLAIVNTCAVTAAAVSDSRKKIRLIARARPGHEQTVGTKIVATGCWATLAPNEAAAFPGVCQVVSNAEKDNLVNDLFKIPPEDFDIEPIERHPIPGLRQRTRYFVKVQDGCDNHCTFCITTIARGSGRSRQVSEILHEINSAAGIKEVILTGVHLGSWGQDLEPKSHLQDLIRAILRETDVPRLRLSSLEPWDLTPEFFQLWENPRLCPHLHLPLQSGSPTTLKRMARKTTPQGFMKLVESARRWIPDVAITTDLIVGFPGETEVDFQESLDFVKNIRFAGGHVFPYSLRPGTPAARLTQQVPSALRKERSWRMRQTLDQAARDYRSQSIGLVMPVLWETTSALGPQGWELSGLTPNYLRVHASASHSLWNQITPTLLIKSTDHGMIGYIQN